MRQTHKTVLILFLFCVSLLHLGCGEKTAPMGDQYPVLRVGMVIGLKSEKIEDYKDVHADSNPGVRDLLSKYHIHNFSIYLQEIDGKWYEFAYYEYTGQDYEEDMALLAAEPRNIEWLKICDPMQIPLPGSDSWTHMTRVYFNE